MIRHGELFAGYGGLGLGLQAVLGGRTVWAADIEPGPRKVLAARLPHAALLGDVTKIRWQDVEPVDVMSGGSPCQDLSHAGRRLGMKAGTRSGLWLAMADAIDVMRPRLVVWENVRGAISASADSEVGWCERCVAYHQRRGKPVPAMRALGRVLGDLADLGYDAQWYGLPASAVGAPHQRFRLFVFATPADPNGSGGHQTIEYDGRGATADHWTGVPDESDRQPAGDGPDGGLSRLLPTPRTTDHNTPGRHGHGGQDLRTEVSLLPTPDAHVTSGGAQHPDKRRAGGHHVSIADAAMVLLPTPAVNDMGGGRDPDEYDEWAARQKAADGRIAPHGRSLEVEVIRERLELDLPEAPSNEGTLFQFLPTPTANDYKGSTTTRQQEGMHRGQLDAFVEGVTLDDGWGQYGPAVRQWEALTRPAPEPVELGAKGKRRLAPAFVEWMMGLPAGWVTDPELGLSRKEQLRALGNGVVPQQAAAATHLYLEDLQRLHYR